MIPPAKIPLCRLSIPPFFYRPKYTTPLKKDTAMQFQCTSPHFATPVHYTAPPSATAAAHTGSGGQKEAARVDGHGGGHGRGRGRGCGAVPVSPPPAVPEAVPGAAALPQLPHTVPMNLIEEHATCVQGLCRFFFPMDILTCLYYDFFCLSGVF